MTGPVKPSKLDFVRIDEPKKAKSRLHLDFRPDDQDAEVARLLAHGAWTSARVISRGWCWQIPKATSL